MYTTTDLDIRRNFRRRINTDIRRDYPRLGQPIGSVGKSSNTGVNGGNTIGLTGVAALWDYYCRNIELARK